VCVCVTTHAYFSEGVCPIMKATISLCMYLSERVPVCFCVSYFGAYAYVCMQMLLSSILD
jgi:hypothetical protein